MTDIILNSQIDPQIVRYSRTVQWTISHNTDKKKLIWKLIKQNKLY
jgi:hypothetical protein